ncbi:MAG: peptide chain release factor N(5)-glutamine methyltransferase [Candidatus Doudnabacteria bacterium]|nr:peptide chain release factor N(5)-glutamine methyltransferase [Candidatus Doudnabacteria bacterium]
MTIQETLSLYSDAESDLLLSFVLKKSRDFLYIHPEKKLTTKQLKAFKSLVARRKKGEPVAYLLRYKDFFGLKFKVTKDTLVPRPETEWVVDHILNQKLSNNTSILDLGTGSGCIAISIKKNTPKLSVTASDVSKKALLVAKQNARSHKTKINFVHSNLLSNLSNKHFDIIIANLPYGWNVWKNNSSIEAKSLKFEPQLALFTKENGLYLYRLLLQQVSKLKKQPSVIYLEFDPRQKTKLAKLIKTILPKAKTIFHKDLAGLWRYVEIKRG